jgi:hypothetical protein
MTSGRTMLVIASVIVVGSLAAALAVMESPAKQRDRRLDDRRAQELEAIVAAIDEAASTTGRLPATLAALADQPGSSLSIADPVDGTPYAFEATAARAYRLCATFATSTADTGRDAAAFGWRQVEWRHPAGRHCFDRRVATPATDAEAAAKAIAR